MYLFTDCKLERIYEKRWYAVMNFISQSRQHLLIMRATWNLASFAAGLVQTRSDGDQRFISSLMTETMQSNKWFGFKDAAYFVHKIPGRMRQICEGCPCHMDLLTTAKGRSRLKSIGRLCGGEHRRCTMATMFLPEVVVGMLDDLFEQLSDASASALVDFFATDMGEADFSESVAVFQRGKDSISAGLAIKTQIFKESPWVVGGASTSRRRHELIVCSVCIKDMVQLFGSRALFTAGSHDCILRR